MTSKDFKKLVSDKLNVILKPHGFKKSGNYFSLSNGDLTYSINVQSSQSSTATVLKLTLNIGISSGLLYKLEDISIPEKYSRHYEDRIGFFSDNPDDKWWTMGNKQEAESAAEEISELILNRVLPTFNQLKSTDDLKYLWQQGKAPGLTDKMRKQYLLLLDKA